MGNIKVITCIVQRGRSESVVKAAIEAGAEGATTFYGRGTGVRQKLGMIGRLIVPEKEVIIIATQEDKVDMIFDAMVERGNLKKAGNGFIFIQDAERAVGFLDLDS